MGAQPVPASPPLSNGAGIEYKAFARTYKDGGAVLSLIATCSYPTSGYAIYFAGVSGINEFDLLETPPSGIVMELVTYYIGSWTNGQRLLQPPTHVTITDASGTHRVKVEPWS
jgi:hypothetical protein